MGWGRLHGCAGVLLALAAGWATGAAAADEQDAVLLAWRNQLRAPTNHAANAAAWRQIQQQFPSGTLRPVAAGLSAWHLMKSGDRAGAVALLEAMATAKGTPVEEAGATMALRWLTRVDRERVKTALKAWYVREIGYPPTLGPLQELPEAQRPPPADRFGMTWHYTPDTFRRITGTRGQRYRLTSGTLGDTSDLAVALERPYGAGATPPRPVRRVSEAGAAVAAFQFEAGTERPVLSVGTKHGGWVLVFAGDRILIMSDGDYWAFLPPPGGGAR